MEDAPAEHVFFYGACVSLPFTFVLRLPKFAATVAVACFFDKILLNTSAVNSIIFRVFARSVQSVVAPVRCI